MRSFIKIAVLAMGIATMSACDHKEKTEGGESSADTAAMSAPTMDTTATTAAPADSAAAKPDSAAAGTEAK